MSYLGVAYQVEPGCFCITVGYTKILYGKQTTKNGETMAEG